MDFAEIKLKARARVKPIVLTLDRIGLSPLSVSLIGLAINTGDPMSAIEAELSKVLGPLRDDATAAAGR